jgi:hypothetical protein
MRAAIFEVQKMRGFLNWLMYSKFVIQKATAVFA